MKIKEIIKNIVISNKYLTKLFIKHKMGIINQDYKDASRKDVFTTIYKKHIWGGEEGFYSGEGSHAEDYYIPYVELIKDFVKNNHIFSVVDLGCGDFHVASKFVNNEIDYIGIDIYMDMIESHNEKYGNDHISFRCMDIVTEELPKADLCLIRQVLQHLDNNSVKKILSKLNQYKYVIITEHRVNKDDSLCFNADIITGCSTRTELGSGLYFEENPFNISNEMLLKILYNPNNQFGQELVSLLIDNSKKYKE